MFNMIDYPTTGKENLDTAEHANRRRVTDILQPLDYVTNDLVGDFIDSHRRAEPPTKSFFGKLLNLE